MKGLIGLEIHTYLVSAEKLFCTCKASRERGLEPNILICPICTGQPGAKPLNPNGEALQKAIQIALMLDCRVSERTRWMRKHYSWPDMPKGYQTTMSGAHATPLGVDGEFEGIRVMSMHLEEDPASWDPASGCVDYNRSGLPLVEIVTAPAFHFAEEVVVWLSKLVHALSYLKVADTNAGIKVDVNVNIPGKSERVEIKNINSLDAIKSAIEYELERQEREGSIRETRRFDESKGVTISMRSKEAHDDYRFIVDPDLLDVVISPSTVAHLKRTLPELPSVKLEKLITQYKIDEGNAAILAKHFDIVEFFERVAGKIDAHFALPWVTIELLRVLNWNKTTLDKVNIQVDHFVMLLALVKEKKITELQAKKILNEFIPRSFDPSQTQGKIDEPRELEVIIKKIIATHKAIAAAVRNGDSKGINFLMGEIMKATERRADYKVARQILEKLLE